MTKYKVGQEIKVSATRVPIYAVSYANCTLKESKKTLVVVEIWDDGRLYVWDKGKRRKVGNAKMKSMWVYHPKSGTMTRSNGPRYEIEVL